MKKQNLSEEATIRNLTTRDTVTVIDDEGNIASNMPSEGGEEDYKFDFLNDVEDTYDASGGDNLRPDGTPDDLDDLFGGNTFGDDNLDDAEFDDDMFGGENVDADADVGFDAMGGGGAGGIEGDGGMGGFEAEPEDTGMDELGGEEFGEEGEEEVDPDFQGVIRTVKGAFLAYKRKMEDGTYEELWMYNINKNFKGETKIRRSVLAGTDIGPQDVTSEDGTQQADTTSVGNVQFLKITGLPN